MLWPGYVGNTLVSRCDERFGSHESSGVVIHANRGETGVILCPVEEGDGDIPFPCGSEMRQFLSPLGYRSQDAVHPGINKGFHPFLLELLRFVGLVYEHIVPPLAGQIGYAVNHRAKKQVFCRGDNHSYHMGFSGPQGGGNFVGPVVQAFGNGLHLPDGDRADLGMVAQRSGHCSGSDSQLLGNIFYGNFGFHRRNRLRRYEKILLNALM